MRTSTIRPTRKAVLLFAISIPVALLIIVVYRSGWYFSLYFPVAVLAAILADIMTALPSRRLHAELSTPGRLYVGRPSNANLNISIFEYSRPVLIQVVLEQSGEAEPPVPVVSEVAEPQLGLELVIMPCRRGQLTIEAFWVRWKGPFGLIETRRRQAVGKKIDVISDIRSVHDAALQFFARDAVYGIKTQKLRGEGTEFDTLCEYAAGMDSRFIDWKRSARHRKLLCKEFRQERNHQIVLGFDTGHLMLEPIQGISKLDHAIKAGLLLSWISLHNGDFVGGCGFDAWFRSFLKPGRGMTYFKQFQHFASGLDYNTEETNFTLGLAELNSRLQRRALVILFTEFVDSISAELLLESLQLMARRHLVIFVTMRDPMLTGLQAAFPDDFLKTAKAVLANDFLRERAIVLERIARLGVHCLDVSVSAISAALLNRYLLIKQRGLI